MGGIYRDANTGKMVEQERFTNDQLRLAEQLGLIDQQAIAKEGSSMRDWDMDMYNVISNDRNFYQGAANMEWGQSQDLVNQYFGQQDRLTDNYRDNRNFDYGASRDLVGDSYKDKDFAQGVFGQLTGDLFNKRDFEYGMSRDLVGDSFNERDFAQNAMNQTNANNQWQQGFDWTKAMDEAGLTGNYNGGRTLDGRASDLNQSQFDWNKQMDQANLNYNYATLDQRKAEFATEQAWREHEFKNMSATDRARLEQANSQYEEDMVWRDYEMKYNANMQREMAKSELDAYVRANTSSATNTNLSNVKGSTSYVAPQEATKKSIDYYLNNFRVSSGFGARNGTHQGTDFAGKTTGAAMGKDIPSIVGGTVSKIFNNHKTAGNGVWITGADGRSYEYIHVKDKPNLKVGDKVQAGQIVGLIGSTGTSTGPHLDLKIKENGKYIDPYKYLQSVRG